MHSFYARNKRMLNKLFFAAAFLLTVCVFIKYVFPYVAPFIFAFLFSLAVEPLVRFICKKAGVGRGVAAALCLMFALVLIVFVGATLTSKIWREAQAYAASLPRYINDFNTAIQGAEYSMFSLFSMSPEDFGNFNSIGPEIVSLATNLVGSGVKNSSVVIVSSVPLIVMNIVLFLISSFFLIKDKDFIGAFALENSPDLLSHHYLALKQGLFKALSGYFKAEFIIMCVVAIVNISGLLLMRYPYALLMGLLIAVLEALPFIGSGFIIWPWALINVISGSYAQAVSLAVLYLANVLTRQFLEPKLISEHVGLYPLVTLISMYAGFKLWGMPGFFIGPFVVICIKIIMTNTERFE